MGGTSHLSLLAFSSNGTILRFPSLLGFLCYPESFDLLPDLERGPSYEILTLAFDSAVNSSIRVYDTMM